MKPCTFQNISVYRYEDMKQIADEYNFEVAIVKLIVKKILVIRIQMRY